MPLFPRIMVGLGFFHILLGGVYWLSTRESELVAHERNAGSALKTLAAAQADYRGNDRDGDGRQEFWTRDLTALGDLGLIPAALARADLALPRPVPWKGYYFRALQGDSFGDYGDGQRFGFIAIPARPGVSGRSVILINEGNSLWAYRDVKWPGLLRWPSDDELRKSCSRFG